MGVIKSIEYRCDWCYEIVDKDTEQDEAPYNFPGNVQIQGMAHGPLSTEDLCETCMGDLMTLRQQKVDAADTA